jgi:PAS domain-containing protein
MPPAMRFGDVNRRHIVAFGLSLLSLVAAVLARWLLDPLLGDDLPLITLYGAIAYSGWVGGLGPAIVVTSLGFLACDYLFIAPPGKLLQLDARNVAILLAYLVTSCLIVVIVDTLRKAQRAAREQAETLRTTLVGIGDAVITTDTKGRTTFLNHVAETLTGWTTKEAKGRPVG